MASNNDVWRRFESHQQCGIKQHEKLQRDFIKFVNELCRDLPDCREFRIAVERLEEASTWAHKAAAKLDLLVGDEDSGNAW